MADLRLPRQAEGRGARPTTARQEGAGSGKPRTNETLTERAS